MSLKLSRPTRDDLVVDSFDVQHLDNRLYIFNLLYESYRFSVPTSQQSQNSWQWRAKIRVKWATFYGVCSNPAERIAWSWTRPLNGSGTVYGASFQLMSFVRARSNSAQCRIPTKDHLFLVTRHLKGLMKSAFTMFANYISYPYL